MSNENKKTILLVEDEAITAITEMSTLEDFGYKVIMVSSGEEAVEAVAKTPAIDLILMDINLGAGIDGTETAALILSKRDIPVVFLSSHTEPEVVEKTEKITSYGYVVKGSGATVLQASIKMAFKLFEAKTKEKEKESQIQAVLAALEKSSRLLRDTGEMAKVGGWELDLSTQEISWTEEVARIHGVEPGYMPKLEEALNFYAPESRSPLEAALKKAAETGEPYNLEALFIPQGSKDKIWVRALGKAVYSGGKIVKLAGTFQNIDKYKKAEEELHKSEKKLREAQKLAHIGTWDWKADTDTVTWTEELYRIAGLDPMQPAPTYAEHPTIYARESWEVLKTAVERAMATAEPYQLELKLIRPDGSSRYVSAFGGVKQDPKGRVKGLYGIVQDITERKQAEFEKENALEALGQQHNALTKLNHFSIELSMLAAEDDLEALITRRIKEITGAVAAIFSEYNPENRTTTTRNIEMEPGLLEKVVGLLGKQIKKIQSVVSTEMYQEMTSEIIGTRKTLHEISFGAISRPVGAAIQALLKVDRFIGVAYLIEGKLFGTSVLAMSKDQPDPSKHILESFSFLAAVSLRRKRAESQKEAALAALRESEEKFREMTDMLPQIVFEFDLKGNFKYANRFAFDYTGYTAEDIKNGLNAVQLFIPEDRQRVIMNLEKISGGAIMEPNEYTGLKKDGSTFHSLIYTKPIVRNEKIAGYRGLVIDISERKEAEAKLLYIAS